MSIPKKPCGHAGCKRNIYPNNVSGYCQTHRDEIAHAARMAKAKFCDTCNIDLMPRVKGNRCGTCMSIIASKRRCTVCNTKLQTTNVTGMCRTHYLKSIAKVVPLPRPMPTFRLYELVHAAIDVTGIPREQLTGPNRFKPLVRVRTAIAHIGGLGGYSQSQIGVVINREHSSVCHLQGRARDMLKDWKFNLLIDRINAQLAHITTARKMERIAA